MAPARTILDKLKARERQKENCCSFAGANVRELTNMARFLHFARGLRGEGPSSPL